MTRFAEFDKSRLLNFKVRIGETGVAVVLKFQRENGDGFDISGKQWELPLYTKPGGREIFKLTEGDGLTVQGDDSDQLLIEISQARSTQRADVYFGLLRSVTDDRTWLNGDWEFHEGKYDGVNEADAITVSENGDTVLITVQSGSGGGGLSTVVTDGVSIEGDGSESLPVKIKDGYLGTAAFSNADEFDESGAANAALVLANSYTDQSVITTFEGLSDVPAYSGNGGKLPNINAAENAVEFGKGYASESSFNAALTFDQYPSKDLGTYNLSSGSLVLTVAGSGNLLHSQIIFKLVADGVGSITFSGTGWDSNARFNIASGDVLTAGTYWVYLIYGKDGVQVSIPGNAKVNNGNMANMATKTYKGRTSVGTGSPEDVPAATVLTDIGGVPTSRTINGMALSADRSIPTPGNYRRTGNSRGVSNNIANAAAGGTQSCAANSMRAFPWFVSEPITFIEILSEVTTAQAATNYRLGIYTDNNGYPNALVAGTDAAEYSGSAAAAVRTSGAVNITINPGKYWIVINSNGNPTLRSWPATILPTVGVLSTIGAAPSIWGWTVTSTYGAMPSTFPAGASANTTLNCPIVVFIM